METQWSATGKYSPWRDNLGVCGGDLDTLKCQRDVREDEWTVSRWFRVEYL
jgi:hypothetical protein